jgi:fatty acid-binding protein DegV
VEPFEQQRTRKRALARLVEIAEEQCPRSAEACLSVVHVEAESDAQALAAELKDRLGITAIPIYELPPAIVVHSGPKAIGIGFFV